MPSLRQRKVAKVIIDSVKKGETPTGIEILKRSNYSKSTSETKSTYVIQSEGVQQALTEAGFSEDGAKKVVQEIMYNPKVDASARLKATDQVFKVHGSYAPEKTVNVNVKADVKDMSKFEIVRQRYEDELKKEIIES